MADDLNGEMNVPTTTLPTTPTPPTGSPDASIELARGVFRTGVLRNLNVYVHAARWQSQKIKEALEKLEADHNAMVSDPATPANVVSESLWERWKFNTRIVPSEPEFETLKTDIDNLPDNIIDTYKWVVYISTQDAQKLGGDIEDSVRSLTLDQLSKSSPVTSWVKSELEKRRKDLKISPETLGKIATLPYVRDLSLNSVNPYKMSSTQRTQLGVASYSEARDYAGKLGISVTAGMLIGKGLSRLAPLIPTRTRINYTHPGPAGRHSFVMAKHVNIKLMPKNLPRQVLVYGWMASSAATAIGKLGDMRRFLDDNKTLEKPMKEKRDAFLSTKYPHNISDDEWVRQAELYRGFCEDF